MVEKVGEEVGEEQERTEEKGGAKAGDQMSAKIKISENNNAESIRRALYVWTEISKFGRKDGKGRTGRD